MGRSSRGGGADNDGVFLGLWDDDDGALVV